MSAPRKNATLLRAALSPLRVTTALIGQAFACASPAIRSRVVPLDPKIASFSGDDMAEDLAAVHHQILLELVLPALAQLVPNGAIIVDAGPPFGMQQQLQARPSGLEPLRARRQGGARAPRIRQIRILAEEA